MSDFTCPMCWHSFDTEDELRQHEEMEAAVDWPLDGYEPSTQALTT
jgi:hypothetical protein